MKRILAILILLCFFNVSYGQQTILVTKDRDNYYEEYSALRSDKKIKHGNYIKLGKGSLGGYWIESVGNYSNGLKSGYWETYYKIINNIKDKGFYKNDMRDSLWTYFYPEGITRELSEFKSEEGTSLQIVDANPVVCKTGKYKENQLIGIWNFLDERREIIQTFNYDNRSIIYLKGEDVENCKAGFIGGGFLMHQYLYEYFDLNGLMNSINTKLNLETGKIIFNFTVDESGNIKDITEVTRTINNKKLYVRALETIRSMNKQWYPRRVNGHSQSSQKTITFDLSVKARTSLSETFMGFELKIKVD